MRSELTARLWPGKAERSTIDSNLNNCISDARAPLGGAHDAVRSLRPDKSVVLDREGTDRASGDAFCVEIDLDEFQSLIQSPSNDDILRALTLVRGRLLHGVEHPWLAHERSKLDRRIVKAIRAVTRWPDARASQALEDFYAKPQHTLATLITQLRADDEEPVNSTDSPDDRFLISLQAHYPNAPKLETLRSLIIPQKPTYHDMSVRLYLRDATTSPDAYELKYQVEFTASVEEFVVGLTTRATLGDLLIAECPQLSDTFTFSTEAARASFAKNAITLTYYDTTTTGRVSKRDLKLRPVTTANARKAYLGGIPSQVARDVTLLRAAVPGSPSAPRHLEITVTSHNMSRRDHYCFWIADRTSYVRRITVDFTRFTVPDGERPRLHPFLGTVAHEIKETDAAYDIPVENWLVKDQGIMLIW
jgi:hypothetical protein